MERENMQSDQSLDNPDQPSTEELMNRVNQTFDQMTEEVKSILNENNLQNNQ